MFCAQLIMNSMLSDTCYRFMHHPILPSHGHMFVQTTPHAGTKCVTAVSRASPGSLHRAGSASWSLHRALLRRSVCTAYISALDFSLKVARRSFLPPTFPSLPPPPIFISYDYNMTKSLSVSIPSSPGSPTSPPSLTMSSPTSPQRTNTLVITRVPPRFFEPLIQQALRSHFSTYGPLHTWAPIKGLARIIMVYYSEEDAEIAKESNDGLVLGEMHDQYVISSTLFLPERPC